VRKTLPKRKEKGQSVARNKRIGVTWLQVRLKMRIEEVISYLEQWAPPILQESYDNSGLLVGDKKAEVSNILVSLDCTEEVVEEAIAKNCNLIVSHHPIVFKGLKRFTGADYVQRTIIKAIQNNIALYAIHTNLDNTLEGVNGEIARRIGLKNVKPLVPLNGHLLQLTVFVPADHFEQVRAALFEAGAGNVGNYSECGFSLVGNGSFKPEEGSQPVEGNHGERSELEEIRFEVILPSWKKADVQRALFTSHPYEEIAHNWQVLQNDLQQFGSGAIGELESPIGLMDCLAILKKEFNNQCIKYTSSKKEIIQKIAICGGSGQFLLGAAKAQGADVFVTADVKYHEFFDAENRLSFIDIGHFESEQFTIDLIHAKISEKFRTFAVHKTGVITNPVLYY
jgi:dinuclear metal center YbgI/SA1388 family protein